MAVLDTASEYLTERRDFLYVFVVPSPSGHGFDIVCRMDGTYTHEADAEAATEGILWAMERLIDVPMEGRDWWAGPPA
jgi:hypothetical protein